MSFQIGQRDQCQSPQHMHNVHCMSPRENWAQAAAGHGAMHSDDPMALSLLQRQDWQVWNDMKLAASWTDAGNA